MSNMSYCRHENTAKDLSEVWDEWDNFDPSAASNYEIQGRIRILTLVAEMAADLYLLTDEHSESELENLVNELKGYMT